MSSRAIPGLALLVIFLGATAVRADEIRLKDGTKIIGTIVGFENDSFRVETSYGFALIQKDKVADINISAPKKEGDPKAKSSAFSAPAPTAALATDPGVAKEPEPKAEGTPATEGGPAAASTTTSSVMTSSGSKELQPKTKSSERASTGEIVLSSATSGAKEPKLHADVSRGSEPVKPLESAALTKKSPATANLADATKTITAKSQNGTKPEQPSTASACPEDTPCDARTPGAGTLPKQALTPVAVEPAVIRDEIRGNTYVNMTYGFQMYKPPSWDLIPDARKELPDAVAALGTYDQTTLLVIGRQRTKDSLDTHAAATGKALSDVYENYRVISNTHVSVAGVPAVEQHARGTADGRDWSVVLLTFLKGNEAFTLLGMTWADSDLIQVQENVLSKALNSLTFTAQ